jgi:hypothetical protein
MHRLAVDLPRHVRSACATSLSSPAKSMTTHQSHCQKHQPLQDTIALRKPAEKVSHQLLNTSSSASLVVRLLARERTPAAADAWIATTVDASASARTYVCLGALSRAVAIELPTRQLMIIICLVVSSYGSCIRLTNGQSAPKGQ